MKTSYEARCAAIVLEPEVIFPYRLVRPFSQIQQPACGTGIEDDKMRSTVTSTLRTMPVIAHEREQWTRALNCFTPSFGCLPNSEPQRLHLFIVASSKWDGVVQIVIDAALGARVVAVEVVPALLLRSRFALLTTTLHGEFRDADGEIRLAVMLALAEIA